VDTEGVNFELHVIPDCPNSTAALELFRKALTAEKATGGLRVVEVTSAEQAATLNFHGSPSFIAHGLDLFPSSSAPGIACRVYPTASGMSGLPGQEDLQTALRARRA
jgi:hypothetical protein